MCFPGPRSTLPMSERRAKIRVSGMMGSPSGVCRSLLLCLTLAAICIGTRGQQIASCALNALPPSTVKVTTNECNLLTLNDASSTKYNLWYKQDNTTSPTTLSVVLGVPKKSNWYGMGFNSQKSSMAGTSAIIFWLNPTTSEHHVHTYSLSEDALAGVHLDETALTYTANGKPSVTSVNNVNYLAFQVEETTAAAFAFQNFVLGADGDVPAGDAITDQGQHEGEISVNVNFVTGLASVTTSTVDSDARTHGILNIVGWGVLLPFGAMAARYGKGFDPHWFYAHAAFQIAGYALVMAGLITGSRLLDRVPGLNANAHKGLAIFLFVLATLQISAVLFRPTREQKVRRYWNWGHWWLGRIALVIAAVNIFVGIHLGKAGSDWKVGYGVVLGVEGLMILVLETLFWINKSRHEGEMSSLPQTTMPMPSPAANGNGVHGYSNTL